MRRCFLLCIVVIGSVGCRGGDSSGAFTASQARGDNTAQSDRTWMDAVERRDVPAAAALLAPDFLWIDTEGLQRDAAETIGAIDVLADSLRGERAQQTFAYGHVDVITSERPGERLMRVWALRDDGWRVLTLIGTSLATGTTPFAAGGSTADLDCDNPCRSMPYVPTSDAEETLSNLLMQLKLDEWHPNPERWAPYVLDGVYYTTATAQLSKEARVEHLEALAATGAPSLPGDPVVDMRIVELEDAAVMFARHDPYRGGQPYRSVRVWAFRDGRWQLANTQQTSIAAAPAVAPR